MSATHPTPTTDPAHDAEGSVVEDGQAEPAPVEGGAALVVAPTQAGTIIRAEHPDDIARKAGEIARSLAKLIEAQRLAVDMGGGRKHVEVGGWQALGMMLGALGGVPLHAETVWTRVMADPGTGAPLRTTYPQHVRRYYKRQRDGSGGNLREEVIYEVDGYDWEARVEIKTPDGLVVGSADAMVSRAEETWSQRDDYALRSMAETRAESRAFRRACGWIVRIAGYNPTPQEEMPGYNQGEPAPTAAELPAWGANINDGGRALGQLRAGIAYLLGDQPDGDRVRAILAAIARDVGQGTVIPKIAARGILHVAVAHRRLAEAAAADVERHATGGTAPAQQEAHADVAEGLQHQDRPAPGTVTIPDNPGDPARWIQAMRDRGCICTNPLGDRADRTNFNTSCPLSGHELPF